MNLINVRMKIDNYCNYFLPFYFTDKLSVGHNEAVKATRLEF